MVITVANNECKDWTTCQVAQVVLNMPQICLMEEFRFDDQHEVQLWVPIEKSIHK